MNILENKQSELINASRFPLMVLVILIHGGPATLFSYSTIFNNVDMYEYISRNISQNLACIAVPCFFLISGFLFFKGLGDFNRQLFVSQLGKRVRTLLIPYLFWNIFFIGIILLKNYIYTLKGAATDDLYGVLVKHTIIELLWSREFPINYPLWYLRDLIVMVLLTPLFYFYFRYLRILGVVILIFINLSGINTNIVGINIYALTYFGIGAYLALNKRNLAVEFGRFKYICLIAAVSFAVLASYFAESSYFIILNRWYVFFGVLTFFNAINFLIQNNNIKNRLIQLSAPVFFIYCVHGIYLIEILRGFFSKTFLAHSEWGLIVTYFLIVSLVLSICTIFYQLLNRYFPTAMSLILGGRKRVFNPEK